MTILERTDPDRAYLDLFFPIWNNFIFCVSAISDFMVLLVPRSKSQLSANFSVSLSFPAFSE